MIVLSVVGGTSVQHLWSVDRDARSRVRVPSRHIIISLIYIYLLLQAGRLKHGGRHGPLFQVDMYLPAPLSDIAFEAFAPTNFTDVMTLCGMALVDVGANFTDVMTLCGVALVDVGANFACQPLDSLPSTLYPSASGLTDHRARLDVGRLLNAGQ